MYANSRCAIQKHVEDKDALERSLESNKLLSEKLTKFESTIGKINK